MKKKALGIGIGISVLFAVIFIFTRYYSNEKDMVEPEFVLTYAENQAADYPTTRGAYKFAELVERQRLDT